jgi:hypothetical protein
MVSGQEIAIHLFLIGSQWVMTAETRSLNKLHKEGSYEDLDVSSGYRGKFSSLPGLRLAPFTREQAAGQGKSC